MESLKAREKMFEVRSSIFARILPKAKDNLPAVRSTPGLTTSPKESSSNLPLNAMLSGELLGILSFSRIALSPADRERRN